MTNSHQSLVSESDTAFDHLVVILRDRLENCSSPLKDQGFTLTPISLHSLGSTNQLITLKSSYIELLGWPAGTVPVRKDIADQPIGFDALVFRSNDALKTYNRLKTAGFDVREVQHLERPTPVGGNEVVVGFETVRFDQEPILGMRLYFCQHLTPEHVWVDEYMRHQNGATALTAITIEAPNAMVVAHTLAKVVGIHAQATDSSGDMWLLSLDNLTIEIHQVCGSQVPKITDATVSFAVDDKQSLNQILDLTSLIIER